MKKKGINKDIQGNGSEQAKRFCLVDAMSTAFLSAGLLAASWQLHLLFVKTRADEPVVFGMAGLLFVLVLCFVFLEMGRHGSSWIATLQGVILLFCATFPFFTKEPGLEPIIAPLFFSVIGGILSIILILASKKISNAPSVKARVIGIMCLVAGVVIFGVALNLPKGMPLGLLKWAFNLISIYLVVFVSLKKIIKGK